MFCCRHHMCRAAGLGGIEQQGGQSSLMYSRVLCVEVVLMHAHVDMCIATW
jgi:hypothetical protein